MKTKVAEYGNSIGMRIPKDVAQAAGIKVGTQVELTVMDTLIMARPVKSKLDDLLDAITPENQHCEIDFGSSEGKEVL